MDCCEIVLSNSENNVLIEETGSFSVYTTIENDIVLHDLDLDILLISEPSTLVISDCVGVPGIPGPGGGATIMMVAASTIQAYHAVAVDGTGKVFMADYTTLTDFSIVLGIALTAALAGETVEVAFAGILNTPALWAPGALYLGTAGTLVATPPTIDFHLQVAVAVSATQLIVRPELSIALV